MAVVALAWGCGEGGDGGEPADTSSATGGSSGGLEPDGSATDGSAAAGGTVSGGSPTTEPSPNPLQPPLFGDQGPEPPAEREGCDKVDFLYVVDNSASMVDKQANLARSFVGFSRIVEETLGTNDHQIMVVDTDASNVNDVVNGQYGSNAADECTGMLGAGLRTGADGEECGITGRQRYLRNEQRGLGEAFSCLAQVGVLGNVDERPIDALLAATGAVVSGATDEVEPCNAGFLREDAILVVTIITDEEDDQSSGDPSSWRRSLLQVKNGNEQGIVVLGLISDNDIPGGLPGDGACDDLNGAPSPRLQRFVESFELGSLGSVCASDYSPFFAEAVKKIDTACDVFEPTLY